MHVSTEHGVTGMFSSLLSTSVWACTFCALSLPYHFRCVHERRLMEFVCGGSGWLACVSLYVHDTPIPGNLSKAFRLQRLLMFVRYVHLRGRHLQLGRRLDIYSKVVERLRDRELSETNTA